MNKLELTRLALLKVANDLIEYCACPAVFQPKKNLLCEKNLKYNKNKKSVCDFYYKNKNEKKPVMLYFHGGGFVSGIRKLRKYYCYEYAKRGYFVANIDYQNAPEQKFPYQLKQIFSAIEFIFDMKDDYNFDTEKIVLAGESAGAYFCTYIAAILKNKNLFDELGISFKYKDIFNIKALVLFNGAYNAISLADSTFPNMNLYLEAFFGISGEKMKQNIEKCFYFSPINFINENFPPSVVVQGKYDKLAIETKHLIKIFEEKNIPYQSFVGVGIFGFHAFCIATRYKQPKMILDKTFKFIDNYNS